MPHQILFSLLLSPDSFHPSNSISSCVAQIGGPMVKYWACMCVCLCGSGQVNSYMHTYAVAIYAMQTVPHTNLLHVHTHEYKHMY